VIKLKIKCEVCNIEGQLQQPTQRYFRVSHYDGMRNKKAHYHYHQNSIEYMKKNYSFAIKDKSKRKENDIVYIDTKINYKLNLPNNSYDDEILLAFIEIQKEQGKTILDMCKDHPDLYDRLMKYK